MSQITTYLYDQHPTFILLAKAMEKCVGFVCEDVIRIILSYKTFVLTARVGIHKTIKGLNIINSRPLGYNLKRIGVTNGVFKILLKGEQTPTHSLRVLKEKQGTHYECPPLIEYNPYSKTRKTIWNCVWEEDVVNHIKLFSNPDVSKLLPAHESGCSEWIGEVSGDDIGGNYYPSRLMEWDKMREEILYGEDAEDDDNFASLETLLMSITPKYKKDIYGKINERLQNLKFHYEEDRKARLGLMIRLRKNNQTTYEPTIKLYEIDYESESYQGVMGTCIIHR